MATLSAFINAISSQESGGNYRAVNANTGALGRYQVMPGNVTPWARTYLGIYANANTFLNSPALQDRLVSAVLGSYVKKYGYRGAAAAWYSGNPNLENNYNPQRWGPSVGSYVDSVMGRIVDIGSVIKAVNVVADAATGAAGGPRKTLTQPAGAPLEAPGSGQKPDALYGQDKNPEPSAVKGVGISLSDGVGSDQTGIEAPVGPTDNGQLGISVDSGITGEPPVVGRAMLGSNDPPMGPVHDSPPPAPTPGSGMKYYNPVPGFRPSGQWGVYPTSGGKHLALDFAVPIGTQVRAPESGTIEFAGWDPNGADNNGGFGLHLRIHNDDGSYVILGHLSSIAGMRAGMRVDGNQVIARSGSTGNSTGPHLHMEFRHSAWDPNSAFNFTSFFRW